MAGISCPSKMLYGVNTLNPTYVGAARARRIRQSFHSLV